MSRIPRGSQQAHKTLKDLFFGTGLFYFYLFLLEKKYKPKASDAIFMKNFKNYIFDLGAVIADINTQNALDEFRALGVPEEELRYDEGPTARVMQNYQLGFLTTDEFCDAIIGRSVASTKPTRQQVADAWNTIIVSIPQQKIDALRTLKKRANIYLLSNTTELHWKKCLDLWFNVGSGIYGPNNVNECFHHIFLSQEMHLEKPNPEIFKQVIREITALQFSDATNPIIDASNTVFLDDNLANVQSAMNCGISSIHVTPDYDWIAELL